MSALNDILNAVQAPVETLALVAPGQADPMPVVIRKLPKKEETLDSANQIIISAAEKPDKVRWLAFPNTQQPTGTIRVEYLIFVTIITPGDGDFTSANISTYAGWREQIRGLFQGGKTPALTGASTVVDLNIDPGVFLPRQELSRLYDYQEIGVRVVSIEGANA